MTRLPLVLTLIVLAATMYLLVAQPVTNWREECRNIDAIFWHYDRDICIPQPK